MALRESDEDYEKANPDLNAGQKDYDEKFNKLDKAESIGNYNATDNKSETGDSKDINSKEETSTNDWTNKVSGQKNTKGNLLGKAKGKFGFLKKKGPATTIILTVCLGGFGVFGILSPGLLIVNFKEVMVSKFNTQLTAMDIRTNKMLYSKTMSVGVCSSVINIRCKYTTMSDRQIANFKKAGIEVEYNPNESGLLGRKKPKGFVLEDSGKSIMAGDFEKELATNAKFRAAVKKGYNPLFAGFADKFWNKTIFKIGISKKGVKFTKGDDDAKFKDIQEKTKNPQGTVTGAPKNAIDPDEKNPDGTKKYPGGADDVNYKNAVTAAEEAAQKGVQELEEAAVSVASSGTKAATKVLGNTIKVTGIADTMCTVYGTIRAVGFAAKVVRAAQLARYAMLFLNVADQIKAGNNPAPEDVEYLGKILTTEVVSTIATQGAIKSVVQGKSATDSFGYKYAAYGQRGVMPDTAAQFLAGGGLTGSLITVTSVINNFFKGNVQNTCKTLSNIFVQVGSAAAGIALAVFSGGISISAQAIAQGIGAAAVGLAVAYLPALLQDIVAGVVIDKSTVGELAGDAITSGSSGLMAATAATGGNTPLTPEQAVAYQNLSNNIAAQYAEEDRLAYSPFDTSNKNTFMGNILSSITPMISKMSSLSGSLTSITSILSSSLLSLNPVTKAADVNDYTMCQDEDYKNLKLAADPFCNLVYGIPTEDLQNIGPVTVLDTLINNGDIDPVTGVATGDYANFTEECTNRKDPIGYTGDDFSKDNGAVCLTSSIKYPRAKYYYLYQVDQRVESGMDGTDESLNAAIDSGMNANISFYDKNINDNVATTDQSYADTNIDTTIINTGDTLLQSVINTQSNEANNNTSINLNSDQINITQNTNICNPTSISGQLTDFGYLCNRPGFNLSKTGTTTL